MSVSVVDSARLFAIAAHAAVGQVRKYDGEPYWLHPQRVAQAVIGLVSDEGIAAAWLHDVVDNTWSIRTHDPEFSKTYLAEKRELLPFLSKGNQFLQERALQCIS